MSLFCLGCSFTFQKYAFLYLQDNGLLQCLPVYSYVHTSNILKKEIIQSAFYTPIWKTRPFRWTPVAGYSNTKYPTILHFELLIYELHFLSRILSLLCYKNVICAIVLQVMLFIWELHKLSSSINFYENELRTCY